MCNSKSLIIFTTCLLIISCSKNGTEPTWVKPKTEEVSCTDYSTKIVANGVLYNNVWNKSAAKSFQWKQCIEKSVTHEWYGWSWLWPEKSKSIFGYPQIKIGTSPWAPEPAVNPEFPLNVATTRSVLVTHELEVTGRSEHNIATSMWMTNTDDIGTEQNPAVITAELMIWTYATANHMNPAGKHIDNFNSDGETWEVWVEKNWSDASGENTNNWAYLTFRAKRNSLSAKFDAIKFVNYGIEHGILMPDIYIADIEVGTEIMSGGGLLWVKSFNVDIQK